MKWDDKTVAELKKLWPDHSATEIAEELNKTRKTTVFTRNAVMGKVHRLELPGKKWLTTLTRRGPAAA